MRRNGRFIITEPSTVWLHILTEGYKEITVVGVFSADGEDTHPPESYTWSVVDRLIKIDFGIDGQSGYAVYEYDDGEESDPRVTVNCGSSTLEKVSSVNVIEETDVNVGDASADIAIIDYKAEAPSGPIEAGRLILIRKGIEATVDAERFYQDELLPLEFSASVHVNGLYLTITPDTGASAVFSYTVKTL
jgi:hypothetical protein